MSEVMRKRVPERGGGNEEGLVPLGPMLGQSRGVRKVASADLRLRVGACRCRRSERYEEVQSCEELCR